MVIWMMQVGIVLVAIFIVILICGILVIKVESKLEVPIQIALVIGVIFFLSYIMDKKEKEIKYCFYFPETEICKAIGKNPGYLTFKQKKKMIQRVQEEDERKNLKKIQDIEVE